MQKYARIILTLGSDLHFLITAVIAKIFNPIAELMIPNGVPRKKQKQKSKYIQ